MKAKLERKIDTKEATICVVGLGYVGLPLACFFATRGFNVIGIDKDERKIDQVTKKTVNPAITEKALISLIIRAYKSGRLSAFKSWNDFGQNHFDIFIIAVDTPVDDQTHKPKYASLVAALSAIGKVIKPGNLIVVESTVGPGTMDSIIVPLLRKISGFTVGKDYFLACCPERTTPNKVVYNSTKLPKIVGGNDTASKELAKQLYSHIITSEDIDTTDFITAEVAKTAENTYKDVVIAFANILALLCEEYGVDVYRVRELINKGFYVPLLQPGAGVGGHCIPKDPYLLISKSKIRTARNWLSYARRINDSMPIHILELAEQALKEKNLTLKESKICILGASYIPDTDDTRCSPTYNLLKIFKNKNINPIIHDPFISSYSKDLTQCLRSSDCLILMTAHSQYKQISLKEVHRLLRTSIIIDGRNVFDRDEAKKLGFLYYGIGNIVQQIRPPGN